jgi:hypothetical protein
VAAGKRLTPAELGALRDFYYNRNGPQEPYWFYDLSETVPTFGYDPTGAAVEGRYAVRFEGGWQESVELARVELGSNWSRSFDCSALRLRFLIGTPSARIYDVYWCEGDFPPGM